MDYAPRNIDDYELRQQQLLVHPFDLYPSTHPFMEHDDDDDNWD